VGRVPRVAVVLVLVLAGSAAATTVPAPIVQAVRGNVAAWERLGSEWVVAYRRGPARGWCGLDGGSWHVGVVSSPSAAPPRLARSRRIGPSMCGNELLWLRAGRLTGGAHREVALAILTTPSIGTSAWIFRIERRGLRLVRRFHADRVSAADRDGDRRPEIVLRWVYAGRSPDGRTVEEVWRFEHGAYRLWSRR
jgi:hypothetical protein